MGELKVIENNLPVTPAAMLQIAVEQGADLDKLEKLMGLQERWEATQAKKAFVSAMNQFKSDPPKITKNARVSYTTDKGETTYDHATLSNVCNAVGKSLSAAGISFRWVTNQEKGIISVTCVMTHDLGHSEKTTLCSTPDQSGGKNGIQAVGSAVTYLQRYTLLAATGLATESQDDDGSMPPDQPIFITAGQIKTLEEVMKVAAVDDDYICKKAGIESLSMIPTSRYESVKNHLEGLKKNDNS